MGLCREIDTHEPYQRTDVKVCLPLYAQASELVNLKSFFHRRIRGAAVARVIPVVLGHPQGHPFKSGRVHEKDMEREFRVPLLFFGQKEVLFPEEEASRDVNNVLHQTTDIKLSSA